MLSLYLLVLPLIVNLLFSGHWIILLGNIIWAFAFLLLGCVMFGFKIRAQHLSLSKKLFAHIWIKGLALLLIFSALTITSPQNALDALKTLIDSNRTVTISGQVIDQCDSLQCRVGGTDADFRLEDGTEAVVKCRFWCGLKNDGYYEMIVTPDEYLMLEAKEI